MNTPEWWPAKTPYIIGDCLECMKQLPGNCVDLLITDPPYGVTQNPRDRPVDMNVWWAEVNRVIKETSPVILTAQFPFILSAIDGNRDNFKYDLIWDKGLTSGFLNAHKQPLRAHEHILIFYSKQPVYTPQMIDKPATHTQGKSRYHKTNQNYGVINRRSGDRTESTKGFPRSILRFDKPHPAAALHPTEKPVPLFEYLIKTYSIEGAIILDTFLGSGTTLVAAQNTGRVGIGYEIYPGYEKVISDRLRKERPLDTLT